ncbi:MAG: dTDP-4-dehydrorhamnose 3,5-epimerase family protein [Acidimicrobiales bacterium]
MLIGWSGDGIAAVQQRRTTAHRDARGQFTEIWRDEWHDHDDRPRQWTLCTSRSRTLRGMHVHRRRVDQLVVVSGTLHLALHDIRPDSPTAGSSDFRPLGPEDGSIRIPPGVVHGFWFDDAASYLLGFSREWDGSDEWRCRFDDPGLGIDWPDERPLLSDEDAAAGSLEQLMHDFATDRFLA